MTKNRARHSQHPSKRHVQPETQVAPPLGLKSVETKDLKVPSRSFAADSFAVRFVDATVQIIFACSNLTGDGWESAVVFMLSPLQVENFLESCKNLNPSFDALLGTRGISAAKASTISQPQQLARMWATLIVASGNEMEAVLDVYRQSPREMLANKGFDPILRVETSSAILSGLLQSLELLFRDIPDALRLRPRTGDVA